MTFKLDQNTQMTAVASHPDFNRNVYGLMGIPVDALSFDEVTRILIEKIKLRSRVVWSTPNVNHLTMSLADQHFKEVLALSELSTVDGMPLVWMAKILNIPIYERVAGSNIFEHLMAEPEGSIKVYFFGGTAETGSRALDRLNSLSKSMRCVGFCAPGYGSVESMSTDEILDEINRASPDILVIALGSQKGHEWILLNAHKLNAPIISHLGSVINFVGGTVARAPELMQKLGFEWLWRIFQEPYLASRYASDFLSLFRLMAFRIIPLLFLQLRSRMRGKALARPQLEIEVIEAETIVRLKGGWHACDLGPLREALLNAVETKQNLRFDLSELSNVTPELIGLLLLAQGHQVRSGFSFLISVQNLRVRELLRLNCAEHLLNAWSPQGKPDTRLTNWPLRMKTND